jgi:hypothetical protein
VARQAITRSTSATRSFTNSPGKFRHGRNLAGIQAATIAQDNLAFDVLKADLAWLAMLVI